MDQGGKEDEGPAEPKKLRLSDAVSVLRTNDIAVRDDELGSHFYWMQLEEDDAIIQYSLPLYLSAIFGFKNDEQEQQVTPLPTATALPDGQTTVPLSYGSTVPLELPGANVQSTNTPTCTVPDVQQCTTTDIPFIIVTEPSNTVLTKGHTNDTTTVGFNDSDRSISRSDSSLNKSTSTSDLSPPSLLPSLLNTFSLNSSLSTYNNYTLLARNNSLISNTSSEDLNEPAYGPPIPPPGCVLLNKCRVGQLISVLAIITQVNPKMDITLKNGPKAGQLVSMASVLISDASCPKFKLSLWGHATEWAEKVTAGDIALLTDIRTKEWHNEIIGHTAMSSGLLNLRQRKRLPQKIYEEIPEYIYSNFYAWAFKEHFYLFQDEKEDTKIPVIFRTSDELVPNVTINFRAKLEKIISNKEVLMIDGPSKYVTITLVGSKSQLWMSSLKKGVGLVWECLNVIVLPFEETQSGYCGLQTTTQTSFVSLNSDQPEAQQIIKLIEGSSDVSDGTLVTVSELSDIKESGLYRVKAIATSIKCVSDTGEVINLLSLMKKKHHKMLKEIMKCVYVGCTKCGKPANPIVQDSKNDYFICTQCPPSTSSLSLHKKKSNSTYYIKPLSLILTDPSSPSSYTVTVTSLLLNKLLPNECAPELIKDINFSNKDQIKEVGVALSGCVIDLTAERKWLLSLEVSCDENSFIISLDATVISIK